MAVTVRMAAEHHPPVHYRIHTPLDPLGAASSYGIAIGSHTRTRPRRLFWWAKIISPTAIIVAFVLSAAVGILIRLYPAKKRKSRCARSIDALRLTSESFAGEAGI